MFIVYLNGDRVFSGTRQHCLDFIKTICLDGCSFNDFYLEEVRW